MKPLRSSLVWATCAYCHGLGLDRIQQRGQPDVLSVPAGDFLGDDGQWTVFTLSVGTPPQTVNLLVSSSSSQLLLQAANGCPATIPDCSADRGGLYDDTKSSSWQATGGGNVTLESTLGINVEAIYGTETVRIDSTSLNTQTVSQINDIRYWIGSVGLHPWDADSAADNSDKQDLISALKKHGAIPSLTFGYTAGAQYQLKGVPGSLTLGGYDAAKFDESQLLQVNFANDATRDLVIHIEGINTDINGTQNELLPTPVDAYIDTTVSDMWLPLAACQKFEDAFGIQWNSSAELYHLNASQQAALKQSSPNVTFAFADPAGGPVQNITISYGAFDLSAEWPRFDEYPNYIAYFPLRRAANQSQVTLGRVLFQETYLFVNFENKTFNLSPTVFSASAPADLIPFYPNGNNSVGSGESSSPSSSSTSNSAVIGGAVGGTLGGLLILGIAIFFFWRRRRAQSDKTSLPEKVSALESKNGGDVTSVPVNKERPLTPSNRDELATGPGFDIYEAASRHPDGPDVADEHGEPMSELHGEGAFAMSPAELLRRRAELGTSYSGTELPGSDKKADAELMGSTVVSAVEVSSVPSPRQASFPADARMPGITAGAAGHEGIDGNNGDTTGEALSRDGASPRGADRIDSASGATSPRPMSPEAEGTVSPLAGAMSPRSVGSPRIGAVSPASRASDGPNEHAGAHGVDDTMLGGSTTEDSSGKPARPGLRRDPSSISGI